MRSQPWLARALGILWMMDGVLQLKPGMFGPEFVRGVLLPLIPGQPTEVATLVRVGAMLWVRDPAAANAVAASIQMLIGVLLWSSQPATRRLALWLSLGWAMAVWVGGEGMGQVFTGQASALTGAPGSALLYAAVSAALLGGWGRSYWHALLVGFWSLALGLQLQPVMWHGAWIAPMAGTPGPLAPMVGGMAAALRAHPIWSNVGAVGVLVLALVASLQVQSRAAVMLLAMVMVGWWGLAMDFGVFGALATDPNTPPLTALLLWGVLKPPVAPVEAIQPVPAANRLRPGGRITVPAQHRRVSS